MTNNTTSDECDNLFCVNHAEHIKDKSLQRFKDYYNSLLDTLESEMEEFIGEDEQPDTSGNTSIMAIYGGRNQLRAEQRKKLKQAIERHKL